MIVNHHGVSKIEFYDRYRYSQTTVKLHSSWLGLGAVEMFQLVDVHGSSDILNKCGRAGWMNDMLKKNSIE